LERLPAEAEAWALLAATAPVRSSRRYRLRIWYRFLAGREPTTALGAEFETYIRAATSPNMAQHVLITVRALCRHLVAQGTTAVYPFPTDRLRPVPADAERWLRRFVNDINRRRRRSYLRHWFRFLEGREPSQELADQFAAELAATRTRVVITTIRGTVNSYLQACAADAGVTPIVVAVRITGRGRGQPGRDLTRGDSVR
jgi:hypothetical protein